MKPVECSEKDWEDEYFLNAGSLAENVGVLLMSPEDAIDRLGGWNSAWELKEDLETQGGSLLKHWPERLNPECRAKLQQLIRATQTIPADSIRMDGDRADNLKAMSLPAWDLARSIARGLAPLLARMRAESSAHFGGPEREV
jgi:hypothetical protein